MTRRTLRAPATEVRVKQRERRLLVVPCGAPLPGTPRRRDTVKLRELPKASTTAARRKAECSTRVTTSGMVTA